MLQPIYIDNTVLIRLTNLRRKVDSSVVTDAVLTATLYDAAEAAVTGMSALSLISLGGGTYYVEGLPTNSLTYQAIYTLVVTCSNYVSEWRESFRALYRPFDS
jgi:hypothetical protein